MIAQAAVKPSSAVSHLTSPQRSYSWGLNEHFSMKLLDRIAASYSTISEEEPELECDCGQPGVKFYGKHTCRYFGKFECNCGNAWTSAYCWKGETQSCKICNKENLPTVTEHLKRGQRTDCATTPLERMIVQGVRCAGG